MIDFIDLGCGIGGSIDWAKSKFGGDSYLGIDNRMSDLQKAMEFGHTVLFGDVVSDDVILPKAKYVTMVHFLEHLRSESDVELIIAKAVASASDFICIRVPFFEVAHLKLLKSLGLRLTWTNWTGHTTAVTIEMLKRITSKLKLQAQIGYLYPILDSRADSIIPYSAPIDTLEYDEALGEKKYYEFAGLYREVYCLIQINSPNISDVIERLIGKSIPIENLEPDHYLNLIRTNQPFSFSRFGDGEVLCMFHNSVDVLMKNNCDGSAFSDALIEPMKSIFKNQRAYYHCLLYCSFGIESARFTNFLNETCPQMKFYSGEVWQNLAFADRIEELTAALSMHKVCVIGPNHLKNINRVTGMHDATFIEVPSVNAFTKYKAIFDSILKKHADGTRLFCFCAGYSTKILIDELFPLIGSDSFLIDFGSVFDPYCGKLSRQGHRDTGFAKWQKFTTMKLQ